jgi:tetratricopeptide (TPR) repeat protein
VAATNFNYQVALKEGLKSLQQGRLRQAEQSFRYLVDKFPGAEGGYRGLAKVCFEQEDRAGALRVLRDGAAALTKSGERSAAIGLLKEAAALDPRDLATHRRLAAALALAGAGEAVMRLRGRDTEANRGAVRYLTRRSRCSIDRARAELGYEPIISTEDGLRETLAWFEQRAVETRA